MKKFILCAVFAMFMAFAPTSMNANTVVPTIESIEMMENVTIKEAPEEEGDVIVIEIDIYVDGEYIGTLVIEIEIIE